MSALTTVRDAIAEAATRISRRDAETLLLHLVGHDRAWLLAHPEALLTEAQIAALRSLSMRRAAQEPLQYLTGQQEFYGLPLHVTRDTLIPRPETELLVEAVLDWANACSNAAAPLRILDIGTGSGAIALALASRLQTAQMTALDLSAGALAVAQENARTLSLDRRIRFVLSDLLEALDADLEAGLRFDIIVSNPPYVPLTDAPSLAPEVRDHEPHTALFAGADGLDVYRRLIPAAHRALVPHGLLALEFGFGQRNAIAAIFAAQSGAWSSVQFLDDYAGIPRVALATKL
jgi:release factor glutamine methyltransferase